jgi:hypothetical protein
MVYSTNKTTNNQLLGNVLTLDNTTPFTPDSDYEPATKKYVDDGLSLKADTTYVDNLFSSTVRLKGTYNATTNTPDLTTAPNAHEAGDRYTVSVAGTFYGVSVEIGDDLTALIDNPTLVTNWAIVQANLTAQSIKTQYESNADTNAYTDAEQASVATIANKANTTDVLTKTNTTPYTPTGQYHPATKAYVDANAGGGAENTLIMARIENGVVYDIEDILFYNDDGTTDKMVLE